MDCNYSDRVVLLGGEGLSDGVGEVPSEIGMVGLSWLGTSARVCCGGDFVEASVLDGGGGVSVGVLVAAL